MKVVSRGLKNKKLSCAKAVWKLNIKNGMNLKCWRRSTKESHWEGTCQEGLRSLHRHPAGRVLAKKLSSDQKNLVKLYQ